MGRGGRAWALAAAVLGAAALSGIGLWLLDRPERPLPASRAEPELPRAEPAAPELRAPPPVAVAPQAEAVAGTRVRVHDPRGRGIAGARVRAFAEGEVLEAETDAVGRGELALGARDVFELEVTAAGFVGLRDEFPWQELLEVELAPCRTVTGRVLDGETAEAIAGAHVHVQRERRGVPLAAEALTDAEGRFRLECAPGPGAALCAYADGYPERVTEGDRQHAESGEIELRLGAAPTLAVRVLDAFDRAPIAGAWVNGACTDVDGRTLLGREPLFEIDVAAAGYCGAWWEGRPATLPAQVEVLLQRGAYFAGRVHDALGRPIAGAEVRFGPDLERWSDEAPSGAWQPFVAEDVFQVASDARGRFRVGPLLPGSGAFQLTAVHEDAGFARVATALAGGPGSTTELDVTLVSPDMGALEGHARLNGKWVMGSLYWMQAPFSGYPNRVDLDLEGNYRFERVPAGAVRLRLIGARGSLVELVPEAAVTVEVEPGRTLRHDFELTLPLGELGGSVTYEDHRPCPGARLSISHADPRYWNDSETRADGSWSDTVPDLGWEFDVELLHGSERQRVSGVRAGDRRVHFIVPELGRLMVRTLDALTGEPIDDAALSWRREGEPFRRDTVRRGGLRLDLHPGTLELHGHADWLGYRPERRAGVEIVAGESTTVELRLTRGIDLAYELAPGLESPVEQGTYLFLLEAEAWDGVRATGEVGWGPGTGPGGYSIRGLDPGPFYPEDSICHRLVQFDRVGYGVLRGLAPGRWRFKAFPEGATVEPAEVELPYEGRLVLGWNRAR